MDATQTFACSRVNASANATPGNEANNDNDNDIDMEDAFQGGKRKEILYKGIRHKVYVSKKQNEFILKNNRKIYIKNLKL